jgi:hypothetical protein
MVADLIALIPSEPGLPVRLERHEPPRRGEHPICEEAADIPLTEEPGG